MAEGYMENRNQELKSQRILALYEAWHIAYLVAFSFNDPSKMPKLDVLMKSIKD